MINVKKRNFFELHSPTKLKYKNRYFTITKLHPKFVIKGFSVETFDGKINAVFINCPHPNAKPRTGKMCIPRSLTEQEINEKSLNIIRTILNCFDLDDCYFTPWDEIEYKDMEVKFHGRTR